MAPSAHVTVIIINSLSKTLIVDGTDGHMSQRAISVELLKAMAVTSQLYKLSDVAARFHVAGMW